MFLISNDVSLAQDFNVHTLMTCQVTILTTSFLGGIYSANLPPYTQIEFTDFSGYSTGVSDTDTNHLSWRVTEFLGKLQTPEFGTPGSDQDK